MEHPVADPADPCPDCGASSVVITCVTVPALGAAPRTVLVTRRCATESCQLKFPVFKSERDLSDEERRLWTRR